MSIQLFEQQNNEQKDIEQDNLVSAITSDTQNNKTNEIDKTQTNISTPINQDLALSIKAKNNNNTTKNKIFSTTNKQSTSKPVKFQLKTKEPKSDKKELKETNCSFQDDSLNICKSPSIEPTSNGLSNSSKFKETYLDLLINSVTELFTAGSLSYEYLNTPNIIPISEDNDSTHKFRNGDSLYNQSNESMSFFSKKCENKSCSCIVERPSDIFQAKIISQKSKSLWLCSKCYNAWKNGQYCYYCNIIYRDLYFNQQHSDSKTWIECDYCSRRMHLQCEEKKGKNHNISKLNQSNEIKYMCPFCVNLNNKNKKEEDQHLRRKRGNGSHTENGDGDKNKKKKSNDLSDDTNDMIKEIELLTNININEKK